MKLSELPRSRQEADEDGWAFWTTGKICRNGHLAPRRVSNGVCVECEREARDRYKKKRHEAAVQRGEDPGQLPPPKKQRGRPVLPAVPQIEVSDHEKGVADATKFLHIYKRHYHGSDTTPAKGWKGLNLSGDLPLEYLHGFLETVDPSITAGDVQEAAIYWTRKTREEIENGLK